MRQALAGRPAPQWRARMLAMLAMLERAETGDLDTADETARQALTVAGEAGDAFATAHALTNRRLSHRVRRDHAVTLGHVDRALQVLGDDPGTRTCARSPSTAVSSRCKTWIAGRKLSDPPAGPRVRAAKREHRPPDRGHRRVLRAGSAGGTTPGRARLRGRVPRAEVYGSARALTGALVHGVTALIAGRRDQRTKAEEQLRAGLALPMLTLPTGEPGLSRRRARGGAGTARRTRQALLVLAEILPRRYGEMTLTHGCPIWSGSRSRPATGRWRRPRPRPARRRPRRKPNRPGPPRPACVSGLRKSDPVPLGMRSRITERSARPWNAATVEDWPRAGRTRPARRSPSRAEEAVSRYEA